MQNYYGEKYNAEGSFRKKPKAAKIAERLS